MSRSHVLPASTPPAVTADRATAARLLGLIGIAVTALAALTIGVLHAIPPTSAISPVSRTISEYGLTSLAWAFNVGVIALAVGSLAVFAALAMLCSISFPALAFALLWIAGLLTLVFFPKHNWAVGPSSSGQVHRLAGLVAFLALPVAVMIISARRGRVVAQVAFWLGVGSLGWFSPILIAMLTSRTAWWQAIPLGLVERGMALTEVAAVLMLGVHAAQLSRTVVSPTGAPTPVQ